MAQVKKARRPKASQDCRASWNRERGVFEADDESGLAGRRKRGSPALCQMELWRFLRLVGLGRGARRGAAEGLEEVVPLVGCEVSLLRALRL